MVRKFRVIASTILEIANIFSEKCHKFSNFLLFHGLHLHILGDLFWNADFHPQYLIQYLHIMNQHKLCFHLTYFFFRLWIFLWKFEDRNKSIQQFYFNILNFCCGFWSKRANFGLATLTVFVHSNLGIQHFEELTFGIEIKISLCQGSFSKEKTSSAVHHQAKNFW